MPICGLHDVRFMEGSKCWCCELLEDAKRIPITPPGEPPETPPTNSGTE